jgi:hypothetical protein
VSLPSWPETEIRPVLTTVAVPPKIGTAPPLTRRVPAASRLVSIVLSRSSPIVVSTPATGSKLLVIAIVYSFEGPSQRRYALSPSRSPTALPDPEREVGVEWRRSVQAVVVVSRQCDGSADSRYLRVRCRRTWADV